MIWLAMKTAAAVFALWGLGFLILDAHRKRTDGTSRQWINYLADRSRKMKPARRICRYSKAG
ncbi:MAG: hypothetical protein IKH57_21345 [Clostridia bacterium]|nr:hypothetical protein [Clostridia bacterium]